MDIRTKTARSAGHFVDFEPGELTLIRQRNDVALVQEFRRMMSRKIRSVILRYHPGVQSDEVTIFGIDLREDTPRHWGKILEVLYRINGQAGQYRHVFHLMLANGDLSGQLYTQTWRHIAK